VCFGVFTGEKSYGKVEKNLKTLQKDYLEVYKEYNLQGIDDNYLLEF